MYIIFVVVRVLCVIEEASLARLSELVLIMLLH